MRCPVCNFADTSVVDTRATVNDLAVRRRRECEKCRYRFSTIEEIELLDIVVIKGDGNREGYIREKVENGIRRSLTKRPYTHEKFHRLIHAVERDIQKKKKREISGKEIGELVMKHLRTFDKVAYIRFASVYRDFKDASAFEKELKKLKPNKS
ncbi:MAG: transcriptional regulator NrdR [Candidatus Magasanikbacteria bacterium RIFOXYC2_FULL_42_28]|uniref:Transcriptional repressor NrdR n=1 Tax=Candidatus Magasanikbacteria bacterium RIFOXYC2_FULL_42_28 TaxID=1798704 RepID=A0A1F6NXS3_9BACT|nr:MAG: transcriptional regulator NrdR [Candidatus Magasanikbacteria bacterium RIFOXYC2_FULL_42_28]